MDEAVIVGTVRLTERDLEVPVTEMSPLFRWRAILSGMVVLADAVILLGGTPIVPDQIPLQLILVGLFVAFLYLAPRFSARQALKRAGDGEVTYRFDDEGVTIHAPGAITTFAYRRLIKVREGSTAFLVYLNPFIANIVPKRAFPPADVDRVRALLAGHSRLAPLRTFPWKMVFSWLLLILMFFFVWQFLQPDPRPPARRAVPAAPAPAR